MYPLYSLLGRAAANPGSAGTRSLVTAASATRARAAAAQAVVARRMVAVVATWS